MQYSAKKVGEVRDQFIITFVLSLFCAVNTGCNNENNRTYTANEVKMRMVYEATNNKTYLIYRAVSETQFYSPGVNINRDKNNDIYLKVLRINIHEKAPRFDAKAEYLLNFIKANNLSSSITESIKNNAVPADQVIVISGKVNHVFIDNVTH